MPREPLTTAAIAIGSVVAAQAMAELVTTAQAEPLPNLADILKDIANALKSQPSNPQTYIRTIEKLVNFAQRDINIQEQNITI